MGNGIITGNKNEITRETLATIRRFIIGDVAFVNSRDGFNFDAWKNGNTVYVEMGMLYVYGYVAMSTDTESFKFVRVNTEQYWFIYAEVDLSKYPNILTIKKVNNGRSTERTFRQDMLFAEKSGVYQRPLWRVHVTNEGIDAIEDVRMLGDYKFDRGDWERITSLIIPNEVYTKYSFDSITGELYLDEADKINKIDMVIGGTYYHSVASNRLTEYYKERGTPPRYYGRISYIVKGEGYNSKMNNVIYCGTAKVLEGVNPIIDQNATATTQQAGDSSQKVATTEFVHTEINNI